MIPEMRPVPARPAPGRAQRPGDPSSPGEAAQSAEAEPVPLSPDLASRLADEVAQRADLLMLAQRKEADAGELAIDRVRTAFDIHEQERAEYLREWNAIRDLSMEQMKKDDEILKKWIALI